ncbi:MAG: DUF3006 domain-containing protein [Deinococcota bacterium]|jgi:hypothetical protein|nr:DUF3006 domain-containing protein [Deinococcota bacterium]
MKLTVDRFEDGGWAVLESDDGRVIDLPRAFLPEEARAGDVIRLETAYGGETSVLILRLDREAADAQRDASGRLLARLRGKDPGGDIEL